MDMTLCKPRYARREVGRAHERFFLKLSMILFLFCLCSVDVWAQDRVQLFGVVRDAESKQPIPKATVTVLDSRFVMETNELGEYAFECINQDKIEITFSCVGYAPLVYSLRQLKRRNDIQLKKQVRRIEEAIVRHRNPKNVLLDIEQRRHLNLGQMLEGTVPGLIFRPSTTTEQEVIFSTPTLNISGSMNLREMYDQMKRTMPEAMVLYPTFQDFQRDFDQKRSTLMRAAGSNIINQTKLSSMGLVPEFRGGSALPGDTKGMLVLVDGFPEAEFPLNMPMANIESVEVIRDPEEGIKYGPEGVNGVVLIKTMRGSVGKPLEIHYTQNFFISDLEDISNKALERISSRDLLDLYRDRFDLDITPMTNLHLPYIGVNPAYLLLNHHRHDKISASEFEHRWDSLGNLDNQQQIRQTQQRVGMQNYNLRLAGRKDEVRYNLSLMYSDNKSSSPGDYMRNFDLNSNNTFSFFKNKIEGNLYVRYRRGENKTVPRISMSLEPYQMLFDEQGNYVYDYNDTYRYDLNQQFMSLGAFDVGRNHVEDQRLNYSLGRNRMLSASGKVQVNFNPSLSWINTMLYQRTNNRTEQFTHEHSTDARRHFNMYSIPIKDKGINYWAPVGNYNQRGGSLETTMDFRSGFDFNKTVSDIHQFKAGLSGWVSMSDAKMNPVEIFYGVDARGRGGDTIWMEPTAARNIYGEPVETGSLINIPQPQNQRNRNLRIGGNFGYSYRETFQTKFTYNGVYIPNYGVKPNYAMFHDASLLVDWDLHQRFIPENRIINELLIGTKIGGLRSPRLPAQHQASRNLETNWDYYSISLTNYFDPNMSNINLNYAKTSLYLGLFNDLMKFQASAYINNQDRTLWSGDFNYNLKQHLLTKLIFLSTLSLVYSLQNFDQYQSLLIQFELNQLNRHSVVQPNFLVMEFLPPAILNHEPSIQLGFLSDRFLVDIRKYDRLTTGIMVDMYNLPDFATGLQSRYVKNTIRTKGLEFASTLKLFERSRFRWNVNVLASFNDIVNVEVPEQEYIANYAYLVTPRNNYSQNALWSYRWGGLNDEGEPTILNDKGTRLDAAEESALVFSGVTIAPNTGSVNQFIDVGDFFFQTRINWQSGGVMRKYIPAPSSSIDHHSDLVYRWRKPGDENLTDIPKLANYNVGRELITQNSTNSILSSDFIRLEEIQVGYHFPRHITAPMRMSRLSVSVQMNNIWFWARNPYGYDPRSVANNGILSPQMPRQYSFSINASF